MDAAIGTNKNLKSFVVYITKDGEAGAKELQELAEKNGIKNIPLTIFDDLAGPDAYEIDRKADVTIMMWSGTKVKINHAYGAGELTADEVKKIAEEAKKFS